MQKSSTPKQCACVTKQVKATKKLGTCSNIAMVRRTTSLYCHAEIVSKFQIDNTVTLKYNSAKAEVTGSVVLQTCSF